MITVLVVDDEALAREGLRSFLEHEPDVEVVGEARNGNEAIAAIRQLAPDLVLLDIQMPMGDGFAVVRALGSTHRPVIVFVTAHDEYAIRAFEVHAMDYLLKPVERSRFRQTMDRVRATLRRPDPGVPLRLAALLDQLESHAGTADRLVIKSGGTVSFVDVEEIDWIEAAGNYARIHTGSRRHLIRQTMARLERELDPRTFVRIHRSTIVNLDRVKQIQPYFKGEHVVVLHDGTKLTLSRTYRDRLQDRIGTIL